MLVATLALVASVASALAADLRVAGSDLLGADFSAALREFAQRNEQTLSLSLDGSRAALAQLDDGSADIGLIVLRPEESPPAKLFKSVSLAYFAVVVLVRETSPLTQITFRQLGGIYSAAASSSFTRWGDLGLGGEWASRAIVPQAMGGGTGLSLELFREVVLAGGELRNVVLVQPSTDALVRKLATDEGGIALASALPVWARKLKVLPVAKADRDVAFGPTPENLHAGDYSLRLPLWLVVRRGTAASQLNFLRFLLGDEIAPLLERAQLVPLPAQTRNQLMFDLEQF